MESSLHNSNLPLNDHLPFLKTIRLPRLSVFSSLTPMNKKYGIIHIFYSWNLNSILIVTKIEWNINWYVIHKKILNKFPWSHYPFWRTTKDEIMHIWNICYMDRTVCSILCEVKSKIRLFCQGKLRKYKIITKIQVQMVPHSLRSSLNIRILAVW